MSARPAPTTGSKGIIKARVAPGVSEWETGIFASDFHGDKHDKKAVAALYRFTEHWKPDNKVLGGDLWDFRPLRRGASPEERRESMQKDFQAGMHILETWKPEFFTLGNHCARLWLLAEQGEGVICDYAKQGVKEIEDKAKKLGCRILPYHKKRGILRFGHLKTTHGFYAGVTAARRTALAFGSSIVGHAHGIDRATIEGYDFRAAWVAGCLCDLDMDFQKAQIASLRHAHGFAVFAVHKRTGAFHVQQMQHAGGTWTFDALKL